MKSETKTNNGAESGSSPSASSASIVGRVYRIQYTHTKKTLGGDVQTSGILSTWENEDDAKDAEARAWREYGWSRDRTATSIMGENILRQNSQEQPLSDKRD